MRLELSIGTEADPLKVRLLSDTVATVDPMDSTAPKNPFPGVPYRVKAQALEQFIKISLPASAATKV